MKHALLVVLCACVGHDWREKDDPQSGAVVSVEHLIPRLVRLFEVRKAVG